MKLQQNVPLANYTSFGLGGPAENFIEVHNTDELLDVLKHTDITPLWLLGFGSNTLISDEGLTGLVISIRGGQTQLEDTYITADAGCWWDDIVKTAIDHNLWGTELMSEIPGSVGAALYINITAYGQSLGPLVEWVDVWNQNSHHVQRLGADDLSWDYKSSIFQKPENQHLIILRVCLKLRNEQHDELVYQKALDVAEELSLDTNNLKDRRKIIIEARKRAGSLWEPTTRGTHTAGSFFRNPVVPEEVANYVMNFDESGKTPEEIKKMNHVHGGNEKRVSAAHVMLATGFKRGQQWNKVKLNDQNLLKIEALPGATAQEVYSVALEIKTTCQKKLGITLEPEARILGHFNSLV